jgi:hypothetical protein
LALALQLHPTAGANALLAHNQHNQLFLRIGVIALPIVGLELP